jgi:hypothetical protein
VNASNRKETSAAEPQINSDERTHHEGHEEHEGKRNNPVTLLSELRVLLRGALFHAASLRTQGKFAAIVVRSLQGKRS